MTRALALALALAAAAPAAAQDLPAFDRFLGSWAGSGQLSGKPVSVRYEWKRTLGAKFVQMDYSTMSGAVAVFSGHALYQAAKGTWHDSTGNVYGISWTNEGGDIVAEWGPAGAPRGKSAYRVLPSGALEVIDSIQGKDGSWREFAKYTARRDAVAAISRVTIATENMEKMVAFYNAVFDAGLKAEEAFGTTVYRGRVAGVEILLCPNSVAKVDAKQNRKQLTLRAANPESIAAKAKESGGSVRNRAANAAGIADPDGNTIEIVQ